MNQEIAFLATPVGGSAGFSFLDLSFWGDSYSSSGEEDEDGCRFRSDQFSFSNIHICKNILRSDG